MRKRRFLAAALVAFASTFAGSAAFGAEKIEVKNPSFEAAQANGTPENWRADPAFFQRVEGAGRDGGAALRWSSNDASAYALAGQSIAIEPETEFEFSVWVKTENVENGGATACVEWSGDGNWLGGAYGTNVRGTRGEWTQVAGRGRVPADADAVSIECYVERGGTGTALFDDFEIATRTPDFLTGIAADAYRQTTDGCDLTFRVGVEPKLLKGASVSSLADPLTVSGDGLSAPQTFAPRAFGSDYVEFLVPTGDLAPGKYVATYSTKNPSDGTQAAISTTFKRVDKFPARQTYIDDRRRAIVDGKPFFPLGLYFGDVDPDELAIFADSAFNCLMPYAGLRRDQLDLCRDKNLRVIYSVKDNFSSLAVATPEEGVERTKKMVAAVKDHPAIFAWYINDELPLTMRDELAARRDLMEELDPGRPTWVVLYQIDEIRGYLSTFDVVGTDPYPIPSKPASTAADYSRRTNDAVFNLRAVWQVPQIFDWAAYKTGDERKNSRPPTAAETRSMAWMSVAGGANGLVFYSWFDLWRMDKTVDEGGRALVRQPFEERWAETKKTAAEIAEYFPILLAVEPTTEVVKDDSPDVMSRLYGFEGQTWNLLVNTSTEPRTVELTAPQAKSVALKLGGKIAAQDGGTVKIELAPLEPCFAVFSR